MQPANAGGERRGGGEDGGCSLPALCSVLEMLILGLGSEMVLGMKGKQQL